MASVRIHIWLLLPPFCGDQNHKELSQAIRKGVKYAAEGIIVILIMVFIESQKIETDLFLLTLLNRMGCQMSNEVWEIHQPVNQLVKKNYLTVACLNYCGIMNSPFEFYCQEFEKELKQISAVFLSLLPKYITNFTKDKFKWEMGKVDVKLRVGRYSPMFRADVGIENGKFLNQQQFYLKWQEVFQIESKKIGLECKDNEKEATRLYDFINYHTMLKFVYKTDDLKVAIAKSPELYLKTLKPFFELSFLNQDRKIKKMVQKFSKLETDVFFFQQYSSLFYNYLMNRKQHIIAFDQTKDTLIIAKETSFIRLKDKDLVFKNLTKEQKDNLNWADRTSFLCFDNYIFINAHLSSKAEKNKPQLEQLKKGLNDLKTALPEYDIILGGDINSYLEPFSTSVFNFFPASEKQLTTIKKRTMTQGQFHKAEKVVEQSKDKIISTLKFEKANISYINGTNPHKQNYVPTNQHPFDHFVLVTQIARRSDDK